MFSYSVSLVAVALSFLLQLTLSACIPVSGSLSISVKRHSRLSFRLRLNLELSSLSLFISIFLISSFVSLSLIRGTLVRSEDLKTILYYHGDHMAPALKSLALSSLASPSTGASRELTRVE